jgi:hypothetical protein
MLRAHGIRSSLRVAASALALGLGCAGGRVAGPPPDLATCVTHPASSSLICDRMTVPFSEAHGFICFPKDDFAVWFKAVLTGRDSR